MEFEFDLGGARKRRRARTESDPMRVLVLGDFSGKPLAERPPLATRPTHRIDVDTLDAVLQRVGPRLPRPAGEVTFRSIHDFHPDSIYQRVELFEALRRARTSPPPAHGTVDDDLGRLLGKATAPAAAPAPSVGGIDALIRGIVAPHIVKDTSVETASHLAAVDAATSAEMRALLHAPSFQALESAWRGIAWLTSNLELDGPLQLHLFDTTREELIADVVAAQGDVTNSSLYRAVVERSCNVAGGEAWSVLTALMAFSPSTTDLGLLAAMGFVAAHANAPLLADAATSLAGADETTIGDWPALRRSAIAPSIALATPRILLRMPYGKVSDPIDAFAFEEIVGTPDAHQLLWGHGALAVTLLLGRGFNEQGWEMEPGDEREIGDLPAYTFTRDGERELQPCAEHLLTEREIDRIIAAGLMPVAAHRTRNAVTVVRMQSVADPPAPLAW